MASFDELFMASKGEPITYNGHTLFLADKFPVSNGDTLVLCIESTNSKRPQGISLSIEGSCEINGEVFKKGKWIKPLFWADSEVLDIKNMEITVFTKKGFVWVQNICEREYSYLITDSDGKPLEVHKKATDGGHNGAAMIVEEIENGRRYRCSDISSAEKEDPFGDIVFTVLKAKR